MGHSCDGKFSVQSCDAHSICVAWNYAHVVCAAQGAICPCVKLIFGMTKWVLCLWNTPSYSPCSLRVRWEASMSPICCSIGPWLTKPLMWAHARLWYQIQLLQASQITLL